MAAGLPPEEPQLKLHALVAEASGVPLLAALVPDLVAALPRRGGAAARRLVEGHLDAMERLMADGEPAATAPSVVADLNKRGAVIDQPFDPARPVGRNRLDPTE